MNKLKVNLKLSVNRIKLLNAKGESIQQHQRREIAQLLKDGKVESARIKHIIRQDYYKEALEVLELFCELLLARFGLFEQKTCDPSIQEAVHTLIYSAARSDVKELITVRDTLMKKFGRDFGEAALVNRLGLVNPRVIHRLNVSIPDPTIVNAYLVEIANKFSVPFTPPEVNAIDSLIVPPVQEFPQPFPVNVVPPTQQPQVSSPPTSLDSGKKNSPTQSEHGTVKSSLSIPKLPDGESSEGEDVDLPEAPKDETFTDSQVEPDFDELAKRFEELKKKRF